MNLYHNEKPAFSRYQYQVPWREGVIDLYLDTGKRDQVLGFFYTFSNPLKSEDQWIAGQFSKLAKALEGKDLSELPEWPKTAGAQEEEAHFPLAFILYRQFVSSVRETFIPWAKVKSRPENHLLCRCFGVYVEDIHELVGSGVDITGLRDLGDHLQAGIGCGTCHDDLLETLNPLLSAPVKTFEPPEVELWEKLDPQSLASEVFEVIGVISKDYQLNLKLGGTRPGSVLIQIPEGVEPSINEEIRNAVVKEIAQKLGRGLKVVFLSA